MYSRRHLLTCLGGMISSAADSHAPQHRLPLVTQSYIWLQKLRQAKLPVEHSMDEMCGVIRESGFRRVELMSALLADDVYKNTKAALDKNQLQTSIVYTGGTLYEKAAVEQTLSKTARQADRARDLGTRAINFGPSPKPDRVPKSDAELDIQAGALNQIGEMLRKKGLKLFNHNHDAEMANNAREWRHMLANTDPALVFFCVDLHWVYRGGLDPLAILRAAGTRAGSLHLRNSRKEVWMEEFGAGDVDYAPIAQYIDSFHLTPYLVVELAYDRTTGPKRSLTEDLTLSRKFAEQVFHTKA